MPKPILIALIAIVVIAYGAISDHEYEENLDSRMRTTQGYF